MVYRLKRYKPDSETARIFYPKAKGVMFPGGGCVWENGEGHFVFDPPLVHSADIDGVPHLISDAAKRR